MTSIKLEELIRSAVQAVDEAIKEAVRCENYKVVVRLAEASVKIKNSTKS